MLWRAATSDLSEKAERVCDGTAATEDMHAALSRVIFCDIDPETCATPRASRPMLGRYVEVLERILRRIPDGWGRWISHDSSWYPIVSNPDERPTAIDPTTSTIESKRNSVPCATTARPAMMRASRSNKRSPTSSTKLNACVSAREHRRPLNGRHPLRDNG